MVTLLPLTENIKISFQTFLVRFAIRTTFLPNDKQRRYHEIQNTKFVPCHSDDTIRTSFLAFYGSALARLQASQNLTDNIIYLLFYNKPDYKKVLQN